MSMQARQANPNRSPYAREHGCPLADSRRIEVLANGLPSWQGAQVAVDATFVSPVSRPRLLALTASLAKPQRTPGGVRAKPRTQSSWQPVAAGSCWRFGAELADFLPRMASLLELPLDMADGCGGTEPPLADMLADARHTVHEPAGRLPARP